MSGEGKVGEDPGFPPVEGVGGDEDEEEDEDFSSDDIMSVSSDDSDVQELSSPLLPDWMMQSDKFKRVVGRKAVKFTHELATRTLNSAEWLLEMTGYGVTMVGAVVWEKVNVIMKKVVEDHYTIQGSPPGGNTIPEPKPEPGDGQVISPQGAISQAYFISSPSRNKNVPPGKPPVPKGTTPNLADTKGDNTHDAGLEAA